jgi:hypothetical protein
MWYCVCRMVEVVVIPEIVKFWSKLITPGSRQLELNLLRITGICDHEKSWVAAIILYNNCVRWKGAEVTSVHKIEYRCIKIVENPGLSLLTQALPVFFLAVKADLGEQSLV